jgi:hypothetical protein
MTLMTYTNLIAGKSTAGSIANWVSFDKVSAVLPTILEEAQALIYQMLRVREMRMVMRFTMTAGLSFYPLADRFLDPIGDIESMNQNFKWRQKPESIVRARRPFSQLDGTLGTNPFTTVNASSQVTVAKTGHGLTQGSSIYFSGATAVAGITMNGTFQIIAIPTVDTYVVETGTAANASTTGGGASVAFRVARLEQGQPTIWSTWEERIQFDQAFNETHLCELPYFGAPALLSATNTTNFLTNRHPQILRKACVAAAADWMEENETFTRAMQQLQGLIQRAQEEDDLRYRGADIETTNWGD